MNFPQMPKQTIFIHNEKNKNKRKYAKLKKALWFLFRISLIIFLVGVITLLVLIAWYSKDLPNPNKLLERQIAQSTKIMDNKGETVLWEIYKDEKRTLVKFEDIPEVVKWATISAEDRFFYEHKGFNIFALVKSVILDPLRGQSIRGGSTITMQLVKNSILSPERTIRRKLKELVLSYRIEKKFTKDEILQMYLNEIPYGNMAYGIGSAAQTYFGKDVSDLTLAEAAYLAGLPKAPSYYNNHQDDAIVRQQYILDQMLAFGHATKEEVEAAKKEELKFREKNHNILAPHFVFYVKEQLVDMFGEKLVEQGGLKVITTLDLEKQKIAEEAVKNGVEKYGKDYNFENGALLAMEPSTGKILAMVGSVDYFSKTIKGQTNVTISNRQPGSSIKPFIYAAAFAKGYTPDTILFDVNTKFKTDGADYEPKNYDLKEHGPVTMRKALQGSLNIPAVKTLYLVGVKNALDFLENFGYTTLSDRSRFGLAIVLGSAEVKLLEHVAAFAVFPNEGVYHAPAAILKVEDSKGRVLYQYEDKKRQVLDANIARMMNNVLSDNNARAYIFGLNNNLVLPGRVSAAKTGTTNDFKDAWTVGYTPSLVAGVWVGNNMGEKMTRGADGSKIAAPIWNEFMRKALEGTKVETFNDYIPPKTDKPILNGKFAIEKTVKVDRLSGKLATENCPASMVEERQYKMVHNILYYVNKDNPQGPPPENPALDPQYKNWEEAVQNWVARQKTNKDPKIAESFAFINEQPPTDYCDVHTIENKPVVFINSPANNEQITSSVLTASVNAQAVKGISRVEFYLDDRLIGTSFNYPYTLEYPISSTFVNGYHKLKIIAYDIVDNSSSSEININILSERSKPSITWQFPIQGQVIQMTQFPLTTTVKISDLLGTKKVNFYQRAKNGVYSLYASEVSPAQQNVSVNFMLVPQPGEYELFAEIETVTGERIPSEIITIIVQ